jgi:hypothetical protein
MPARPWALEFRSLEEIDVALSPLNAGKSDVAGIVEISLYFASVEARARLRCDSLGPPRAVAESFLSIAFRKFLIATRRPPATIFLSNRLGQR